MTLQLWKKPICYTQSRPRLSLRVLDSIEDTDLEKLDRHTASPITDGEEAASVAIWKEAMSNFPCEVRASRFS